MANGVYLFEDAEDFLKAIEDIQQQYDENKQRRIIELNKQLFSTSELRKEINFLNNCRLNSFMGCLTKKIIKVNITYDDCDYSVTYYFKGSTSSNGTIYKRLHRYLRKREWNS